MKNLNKAILIAMGMALPLGAMASPDDDVTIRMMDASEHAGEAVTREIELPDVANEHAKEHAARGMDTANKNRNRNGDHDGDMDRERDRDHEADDEDHSHDMDREREREREHEMEREMEREHEMEREDESDREDRRDVEHDGMDREEVEREYPDGDHGSDSQMEREDREQDMDKSSDDMK